MVETTSSRNSSTSSWSYPSRNLTYWNFLLRTSSVVSRAIASPLGRFDWTRGVPHVWTTGKAARYHVTKIITDIVTLATFITG